VVATGQKVTGKTDFSAAKPGKHRPPKSLLSDTLHPLPFKAASQHGPDKDGALDIGCADSLRAFRIQHVLRAIEEADFPFRF
jgi:hypothetical protein